jgi:hypothetical protein
MKTSPLLFVVFLKPTDAEIHVVNTFETTVLLLMFKLFPEFKYSLFNAGWIELN